MSRLARGALLAAAVALALLPLGAPALGLPGKLAPRGERGERIKAMLRRTPLLDALIASGRVEVLDQYSQGESPVVLVRGEEADLRSGTSQPLGRRVHDSIHLRSRVIDSTRPRPASRPPAAGGRLEIVQFHGPIKPQWLARLRAVALAKPIAYLPDNAYVVWADQPDRLESSGLPLQWREPFTQPDRLSPELVSTTEPTDVTIQVARAGRHEQVLTEILALATTVLMQPRPFGPVTNVRVTLPGGAAERIAQHPEVVWIEPFEWPVAHDERSALTTAGMISNHRPLGPGYQSWLESKGLGDLSAVLVDVTDSGIDRGPELTHPCLQGRVVYSVDATDEGDVQDCRGHGTNVAGIIAGSPGSACALEDEEGYSLPLGVAPTARLGSTRISKCSGVFGPSVPFTDLVAAAYERGARIGNNSWGGPGPQYNTLTAEYDALVRDANLDPSDGDQGFLPIFSAGNLGPIPSSVGWPSTAKNVLSAGATENFRPTPVDGCGAPGSLADSVDHVLLISGRGPTADGRVKPDLVAPGSHIVSLASTAPGYNGVGVCDAYFPLGQRLLNWSTGTSMAAAHVSGAAAVASEIYRQRYDAAPSPAMIKAMLIAHAHDMAATLQVPSNTTSRPNADQGWGRVDLGSLVDSTTEWTLDQQVILKSTGESASFEPIVVEDPTRPVVVTLVWTDAPGTPAGWSWVNDLDLRVRSGGATYLGNMIQFGFSVTGGEADERNNVEVVILPPGRTLLSVEVEAANIAADGVPSAAGETDQDFALYASNVRRPVVAGTVALPQGSASCGSPLEVRVSDLSLRGFGRALAQVDSGADSETLRLDESPPGSGVFKAAVPVTGGPPLPGDGLIQTADGGSVSVTYVEPDPDSGALLERVASVPARCVPPKISGPRVRSEVGEAIIEWETDRPSTSVVSFGLGAVRDRTVTDLKPVTRHKVRLSGLTPCAFHTATVRSDDSSGSSAEAPAAPLRFATGLPSSRRIVYRDDMERLGSGWHHQALPDDPLAVDDWEMGFPGAGPPGPFSGSVVWGTNLDGIYSERLDAALTSPPIDLRDAMESQLTFMHYYSINGALPPHSRNDGGWVEISTDGGTSWSALDPIGGYTDLVDGDNPYLPDDAKVYAGTTSGWGSATFDLSPYDGDIVRVRFRIWQDAGESAPRLFGWYIDDIEVTAAGACHLGRLALDSDEYGCSSRVVITLQDSDLDLDHARTNAAQVTASSPAGGFTVSLAETGPDSGVFRGEVMTRPTFAPGSLVVSEGDTITVTYSDANDGGGSPSSTSASALVPDCTPPPAPSGVAATADGSGRVIVTWDPVDTSIAEDLQGYRVHYDTDGSGPGYTGKGALQGASPVRVEASPSTAGLSSLGACSGYFITVTAFDRLGNESAFAPESFAVADGALPCATGRISVEPAFPGCSQIVSVTVTDSNLDADPGSSGTATARASGPSHAGDVPVALVESSPFSGVFVGTLALTPTQQAGALQVSGGDAIRLEYEDANDGFGATRIAVASASVGDCTPPVISGVEVTETRSDTAVIRWITDEPASSTVRYGSDATSLGLVLTDAALTTQHSFRIRSLSPCSPVFFTVSSADSAANAATATDSGSPFRFGTFRDILLFTDDFGSGAPGWTHSALGSSLPEWELGTPPADPNGPPPPYSGGAVWGTDLDGTYEKGADIALVSPPIDLTEVASAYLRFRHWYQIASAPGPPNGFDDGGFLEVSRDGGETWQYLPHGDPLACAHGQPDCYPDRLASNPYTPFGAGAYGGSSGGWVSAKISLDEHVGHVVHVRFHLFQDAGEIGLPRALGWYIDDVTVTFGEACRAGRISFDRGEYPCSSEIRLVLSDVDLDADPLSAESASVLVTSEAEPAGEVLTLAETGASTALFEATLTISGTDGPGVLQVRDGDSIAASYADTDDGTGSGREVTARASVLDCTAPVASGVRVTAVGPSSFTVAWETSEPASSRVLFGSDPTLGGATTPGSLGTHHAVTVSGLAPCTLYFFTVESTDPSGNGSRDDATAGLRQVTTLAQAIALEEGFESAAAGWRGFGQGGGWQIGATSDPPPPSGARVAGAPLSGSYTRPRRANDNFVLESPPFNLAGLAEPSLTFQHSFDFTTSFLGGDGGRVEAWDGSRWIALTPEGGYPALLASGSGPPGERVLGYGGRSLGYVPARFDLGPIASVVSGSTRIRFRVFVGSGAGPTGRGWKVDDVRVAGTAPCRFGRLAFDRGAAACPAQALNVSLHDTDLDIDPLAADSATITVESSGGPAPLSVGLVERGVAGGSLHGAIPLSIDGTPGSLRANAGDLITASYEDQDDGTGASRTHVAHVQITGCPAPVLSRVTISSAGTDSVVARWTTDQPSTSAMILTPESGPSLSTENLGLVTGHRLEAFGVAPCQIYSASLASENAEGARGELGASPSLFVETVDRQVLFFDDMEGADPGWARSGEHSEWARLSPVFGPGIAFSGLRAFVSNPGGLYRGETNAMLTSPPIDLSGVPAPRLTFWHWYEVFGSGTPNSFDDAAWLEVQAQGENPVRVDPLGGYPDVADGDAGSPLAEGAPVYAGRSRDWERASFDLSPFTGKIVRLRFRLWNDVQELIGHGATGAGWYIDDVEVSAQRFCHPAPSLAPGSLGTAMQGESLPSVGIQGAGLRPGAAVSLGPGITVSSLVVDSPTHLTLDLTVDLAAAPGPRNLTVINPDGQTAVLQASLLVRASPLASDIDGSGRIDGNDLVLLAAAFGAAEGSPSYRMGADINRDGIVDGLDLALLASSFGTVIR